jgi:uncharacterized membrane protein YgdD (TMEM256/DUF423 family)
MPTPAKTFLLLGALACMLAVLLGAFGAHALRGKLAADLLAIYQTAVQYHFWHALGLLAIGWLMLAGILVFSGSLYLLALTGARWMGAVTPIGGTAFIASWTLFAFAIARASSSG